MRKLIPIILLLLGAYVGQQWTVSGGDTEGSAVGPATESLAYGPQHSDTQVRGQGVVATVLTDDNKGSRHQRFILRLGSGQTILVAHNIDLAPRIPALRQGDTVAFYGEYEWNDKGGVVHWTHRDKRGSHADGWLQHDGMRYD